MGVSMKEVAKKAGVSTATVSHVINGTRFVSKETKKLVIEAMDELDYHPNLAARSLRSQKSNIIGFLVPDISNFFFTEIAKEVEKVLRKKDYNLVLSNTDENIENEKEQLKILNAQQIDGLIMAPTGDNHNFLEQRLGDYPVIFIDRKPRCYKGYCVLVNNYKGSYEATSYLIKKGHKQIAIITGLPDLTTTEERLKGYKQALIDNHIKVDKSLIKIGDSRFDSGYDLTRQLLKETNISALYVTNNLMSIGAMEYLNKENVKIPEELSIIGFDDYKWASITSPPLSVVKQPVKKIGEKVSELLLENIKSNNKKNEEFRLPTKLIIRNSC